MRKPSCASHSGSDYPEAPNDSEMPRVDTAAPVRNGGAAKPTTATWLRSKYCDGLLRMVRHTRVLSAMACVLALAACSDDKGSPEPSVPSVSPSPSSGPFAGFSAQIGAASVLLSSCIPRFTGDQSEWCTGTHMWGVVNDVTTALKNDIASHPGPTQFADVSSAITSLDKSAGVVKQQCDHVSGHGLNCLDAFDAMMADWRQLTKATVYN